MASETERELVKEVYVQSTCLQGEQLASYAIWDKAKKLTVEVELPEKTKVIAVNNVKASKEENGKLKITDFDENGYLGIILKTEKIETHSSDANIVFHFEDDSAAKHTVTKSFHLFRPDVKATQLPVSMNINVKKEQPITIENKLKIRNEGEGIGVISFILDKDSELKIGLPGNIGSFLEGFVKDINKSLVGLSSRYTNEKPVIDEYLDILVKSESGMNEEVFKRIKGVVEKFEYIMETNDAFAEEFGMAFGMAFYKNINIITDFESLLAYVASVTTRKIALTSPINTIKFKAGRKYLKGKIQVMDLGFNIHNSIPINIAVESETDGEIPLYKAFE